MYGATVAHAAVASLHACVRRIHCGAKGQLLELGFRTAILRMGHLILISHCSQMRTGMHVPSRAW